MNQSNFTVGDHVLLYCKYDSLPMDIWVGTVVRVDDSGYLIKNITTPAKFYTKIPFALEPLFKKIESDKVDSCIKVIKLLYYT